MKKGGALLSLSRNQLRIMTRVPKGHWHLKGHLFKLGLVNSPEHGRHKQAFETASRILCEYEALATLRIMHLGCHLCDEVTLKTTVSAGYCTLFKVWGH
jgi:hypothetical protein